MRISEYGASRGVRRRSLLLGASAAVAAAAACDPDPASPRPGVTASVSPAPSPSPSSPTGGPATGVRNQSTADAPAFPLPMLYAAAVPDRDLQVFRWDAAKLVEVTIFGTAKSSQAVLASVCGSPDGTWLAWIEDGFFMCAAPLAGSKTKFVGDEAEVRGSYPQWLPDRHTLASTGESELFTSNMDSDESLLGDRPVLPGYVAWSADGRRVAYITDDDIVVQSGARIVRRRSSPSIRSAAVTSLSDGGHYAVIGSDPWWQVPHLRLRQGDRVVDTTTGALRSLPAGIQGPVQLRYAGSTLIVRRPGTVTAYSMTGLKLASAQEPSELYAAIWIC